MALRFHEHSWLNLRQFDVNFPWKIQLNVSSPTYSNLTLLDFVLTRFLDSDVETARDFSIWRNIFFWFWFQSIDIIDWSTASTAGVDNRYNSQSKNFCREHYRRKEYSVNRFISFEITSYQYGNWLKKNAKPKITKISSNWLIWIQSRSRSKSSNVHRALKLYL